MLAADGLREKLAGVLIRHGRVLMTRNQGRDVFYFPGGMREPGESDAQALVREIDEELQAAIDETTMAHVVTVQAPGDGRGPRTADDLLHRRSPWRTGPRPR